MPIQFNELHEQDDYWYYILYLIFTKKSYKVQNKYKELEAFKCYESDFIFSDASYKIVPLEFPKVQSAGSPKKSQLNMYINRKLFQEFC